MTSSGILSFQARPPKGSLPAIIYALAVALLPYISGIHQDLTRSWVRRTRAADRVNRIFTEILALIARMHPQKLGTAAFTRLRPPAAQAAPHAQAAPPAQAEQPASLPQNAPATPRTKIRRRTLSARQVASRLAFLLRELVAAAHDAGHPLPPEVRDLCAQARAAAGCDALPPNRPWLKPGFFDEIMTLPPWYPLRL